MQCKVIVNDVSVGSAHADSIGEPLTVCMVPCWQLGWMAFMGFCIICETYLPKTTGTVTYQSYCMLPILQLATSLNHRLDMCLIPPAIECDWTSIIYLVQPTTLARCLWLVIKNSYLATTLSIVAFYRVFLVRMGNYKFKGHQISPHFQKMEYPICLIPTIMPSSNSNNSCCLVMTSLASVRIRVFSWYCTNSI